MATDNFFRSRLDQLIDLRHPLAVPAQRLPWSRIEAALAPTLAHKDRVGTHVDDVDLFGPSAQLAGAGVSAAGRPRLSIRLLVAVPEARVQPERRGTGRALGRERHLAVLQRQQVLRTAPAV